MTLLIEKGADVQFELNNKRAVDLAWINKHYEVVLTLLKAGSDYPIDFNSENTQKSLEEFVNKSINLHESIKLGNLNDVKRLVSFDESKFYLNLNNESVCFTAIEMQQFDSGII